MPNSDTDTDIIERVRPPFRYLFDRYQYKVIGAKRYANSGNWIVVLESPSCGRFLVFDDGGEIIVALGPAGSPDSATDTRWFDLAVIVEHLSAGKHMLESQPGDAEQQMTSLAGVLRPYMDQICPLFAPPNFAGAAVELDRIGKRREEEIRMQDMNGGGDGRGE